MEAPWQFWLRCDICEATAQVDVRPASLHRLSSGGFSPLRCGSCGALSARPGPPPWQLSANDRKFLRSMRITPQ